jgi:hypothetical protein
MMEPGGIWFGDRITDELLTGVPRHDHRAATEIRRCLRGGAPQHAAAVAHGALPRIQPLAGDRVDAIRCHNDRCAHGRTAAVAQRKRGDCAVSIGGDVRQRLPHHNRVGSQSLDDRIPQQ